jgi:outer membrane protein assembly factor BamD (BamD/ComL family)
VRPYDHAPSAEFWPNYVRGLAHLEVNDAASAITEFQAIIDHRGQVPASPLYPLAHLGAARAAMLRNDPSSARAAYDTFLAFWKGADADVPELQRARHEQARLGAGVAPEARAHVAEQ